MYCLKILQSNPNLSDGYFSIYSDQPQNKCIQDLIPDFFISRNGTHISIICGDEKASDEVLVSESLFTLINADNRPPKQQITIDNIVHDADWTYIYADSTGLPDGTIIEVATHLSQSICSLLNAINCSAIAATLTQHCNAVVTFLKYNTSLPSELITNISNTITQATLNRYYPQVYLLIYVPSEVFDFFDSQSQTLCKQIEYVLLAVDPGVFADETARKLSEANIIISELKSELQKITENNILNNLLSVLQKAIYAISSLDTSRNILSDEEHRITKEFENLYHVITNADYGLFASHAHPVNQRYNDGKSSDLDKHNILTTENTPTHQDIGDAVVKTSNMDAGNITKEPERDE